MKARTFFSKMDLLLEKEIVPPGAMHFIFELMRARVYSGQLALTVDEAHETLAELFAAQPAQPAKNGDAQEQTYGSD